MHSIPSVRQRLHGMSSSHLVFFKRQASHACRAIKLRCLLPGLPSPFCASLLPGRASWLSSSIGDFGSASSTSTVPVRYPHHRLTARLMILTDNRIDRVDAHLIANSRLTNEASTESQVNRRSRQSALPLSVNFLAGKPEASLDVGIDYWSKHHKHLRAQAITQMS